MGPIRLILHCIKTRKLPVVVFTSKLPDGTSVGKCSKCGAEVQYSKMVRNTVAFKCAVCGEQVVWQ